MAVYDYLFNKLKNLTEFNEYSIKIMRINKIKNIYVQT